MDIFEVLSTISKRKKAFIHGGINAQEALVRQKSIFRMNITYLCLTSRN
jgi:hypothetical protein